MKVYHLSLRPGWLGALASLLDRLHDNDIIVLPSDAACDLARSALRRRPDNKYIRIMTEEVYEGLQRLSGENLEEIAERA